MLRNKVIIGLVVVGLLGFGLGVYAGLRAPSGQKGVPSLIPYHGILEQDGVLVNAIDADTVSFRVSLWDEPGAGTKVWPPVADVYDEHSVNVYDGRFAFDIGSDFPYEHVPAIPLFLDIQVRGPGDAEFVQLGGRQRFLSAPFAVASSRADTNFEVPGQLNTGSVVTTGTPSISIQGATVDSADTLRLQTNSQADTVVGGNLVVGNDITGGAGIDTVTMTCRSLACGMQEFDLPEGGTYGSWRPYLYCPEGTYVCGARQRIEGPQGGNGDDTSMNAMSIACCPF